MSFDFINTLTSIEDGILGLTMFVAPDYFWNPADGLLGRLSFARTSFESSNLDAIAAIMLRGTGACKLTLLLYHALFVNNVAQRLALARLKILLYLAQFALFSHAAFLSSSDMFVKEFFAFLSGIEVMSAMWLGVESYKTRRPDKTKQESLASPLVQACLLGILYTAPFAIMLAFFPSAFGPNGKAHFFSKTSLHDGSLDALEIFTIRLEGLHLLCYCTAGIEGFQVLPVSLNRFTMIAFILFAYVFAVASRDETGYLNKKTYEASLLLHLLVCGGMWKLQTSRKAKTVTKKSQ